MAVTARYRIRSNEVEKISLKGQTFSDRDIALSGVLTNPTTPDGTAVRDRSTEPPGPLRVLGLAKIAEPGTNNVRNATQPEIDTFAPAQTEDESIQDADGGGDLGDTHPRFRRLTKSILKGAVREHNIIANRYNELRAEMLAATSLADLQNRITNNTSNAPTRTNQQAFDAIRNDVDKDD